MDSKPTLGAICTCGHNKFQHVANIVRPCVICVQCYEVWEVVSSAGSPYEYWEIENSYILARYRGPRPAVPSWSANEKTFICETIIERQINSILDAMTL